MRSQFQAVLRGSILIVACVVWFGQFGCLQGAKVPTKDLVDCYAKALDPVAGEVFDTVELAKDLVAGKADLGAVLRNLQVDEAAAASTLKSVRACTPPPAPAPDADTVAS